VILEAVVSDTIKGFSSFRSTAFPSYRLFDSSFKTELIWPKELSDDDLIRLAKLTKIEQEAQIQNYLSIVNKYLVGKTEPIVISPVEERNRIKAKRMVR